MTLTLNNETISKKSGGTTRNKRQNTQILKAGLSLTSSGTISFVVLAVDIATFTTTAIASYAVNVGFNSVHSGISYIKCEINTDNISYDDLLFYAQNENDASDIHETIPFLNDYKKPYVLFDELEPNTEYFISAKEKDTNKIYKISSYSTLEIPYYNVNINLAKNTLYSMTFDVDGAANNVIEASIYNENNIMIDSKTFYDGVVSFGNLQPTEIYTLRLFQEGFEVANRTFATSIIVPEYEIVFRELDSTHIGVSLIYDYNQETSFSLTLLQDGMYAGQLGADGGVYYYNDLIPGTTYILRLSNFSTSVIEDIEFQCVPIPEGIYVEEAENLGDSVTYNLYNLPDDSDLVFAGTLYKTETGEEIEQISVYRDTFTFGKYGGLEPVTSYYFDVVFEHYRLDEPIFITSGEFKTTFF